jgi:hypothetical protein
VNVFFEHRPEPAARDRIRTVRSTDGGATWSPAVTVAETTLGVPFFPGSGLPLIAPGFVPDIAVDRWSGELYAVWADAALSTSGSAVALAKSADGLTWTTPIRVDRSPPAAAGGPGQAFLPQVDVAADRTVAVTYYDFRSTTPESGTLTDYWMVTCRGSGCAGQPASWTELHTAGPLRGIEAVSPSFGGPFVGTYVSLAHCGVDLLALYVQPTADPANPQDVYLVRVRR